MRVPVQLYARAHTALAQFPQLGTGVTLNQRDGQWYATFVVERRGPQPQAVAVIGLDMGLSRIVSPSTGQRDGPISPALRQRVERSAAKRRRKHKLNAGRKRQGRPPVDRCDHRAEALARTEIGRALHQMRDDLPAGAAGALERLTGKDMRFQSRQMNRAWRAAPWGYGRDKLKFQLDERGIRYRSVQPAYSSPQCSQCGFTFPLNRRSQAEFGCLWCGYEAHADENAAANLAERFGDAALNALPFREVETALAVRRP